jgi:hypothetical protein
MGATVKVILFGASGSAGGSVLVASLMSTDVDEVRAVTRRPLGFMHPKLTEVRHENFADFGPLAASLTGVDGCLYCLGKSVQQVPDAAEYRRITYDVAMAAARALNQRSPNAVFQFISGQGAGLKSRFMWARVKGETELDLIERFDAVCWRPAMIDGVSSSSEPPLYRMIRPAARLLLKPFKSLYVIGEAIGCAMVLATLEGVRDCIIENAQIRAIARSYAGRLPLRCAGTYKGIRRVRREPDRGRLVCRSDRGHGRPESHRRDQRRSYSRDCRRWRNGVLDARAGPRSHGGETDSAIERPGAQKTHGWGGAGTRARSVYRGADG